MGSVSSLLQNNSEKQENKDYMDLKYLVYLYLYYYIFSNRIPWTEEVAGYSP